MINVSETKKYIINPKRTVEKAFEGAYVGSLEKMPTAPPDYMASIWGAASILFVGILYYITAILSGKKGESATTWYGLSAACVAIVVIVIYKLIKNHNLFKKSSGGEDRKEAEKKKFFTLMGYDNLPEELSATEYAKKISPMLGKQTKELYNVAIRKISEYLASVNNPDEISCKLLTPFGNVFNQSKKRFYMSVSEGTVYFTDFDFSNPKGEISCSENDIVSYGFFAKYPQSILPAGTGKVRPDAVILEVKDEDNHIYFEFLPADGPKIKKMFSAKKELK